MIESKEIADLNPIDCLKTGEGKELTISERIENCELVVARTVQKLEEVLKVYRDEIQKTQRAVLNIMANGTKKQKKLVTPAEYRKPYIRNDS